ncbi:MAG: hypothetical protein CMP11_06330 [Zetaproteobacteria bacterium]|nr:hypothetical protein [Pseudobdellovibrionaceae bacterium]|tara:strand:- start:2338 stop:3639 length:1302 start_codon:yes stop_codon:yes gene_type:complete
MFQKKEKKGQEGFSLVEVMIASSISIFIGAIILVFIKMETDYAKAIKYSFIMKKIAKNIELAASTPTNLRGSASISSAEGNMGLRNCLLRLGATGSLTQDEVNDLNRNSDVSCSPSYTNPSSQIPFELYTIPKKFVGLSRQKIYDDRDFLRRINSFLLAGTRTNRVFYRLSDGSRCLQTREPNEDCQIEAIAYFWASCPAEKNSGQNTITPTSCPSAQAINVRYQVIHHFNSLTNSKLKLKRKIPSIPPDEVFWINKMTDTLSTTRAITTPTSIVPSADYFDFSCETNYTITRIEDGQAVCECKNPYVISNGQCIRNFSTCLDNQRFRGFQTDGSAICQNIYCVETQSLEAGCRPGGWIETLEPIEIEANVDPGKGDGYVKTGNACATIDISSQGFTPDRCGMDSPDSKNGGVCETAVNCIVSIKCCYEVNPY